MLKTCQATQVKATRNTPVLRWGGLITGFRERNHTVESRVSQYTRVLERVYWEIWAPVRRSRGGSVGTRFLIVAVGQLFSCVWPFATPRTVVPGFPAVLCLSLLRLMSTELMIPSDHLILCCPLLLLPSVFPSTRFALAWVLLWSRDTSRSGNLNTPYLQGEQLKKPGKAGTAHDVPVTYLEGLWGWRVLCDLMWVDDQKWFMTNGRMHGWAGSIRSAHDEAWGQDVRSSLVPSHSGGGGCLLIQMSSKKSRKELETPASPFSHSVTQAEEVT